MITGHSAGALLLVVGLAVGTAAPDAARADDVTPSQAGGDATVVAVIDSGFSPYHWDFLASMMPQALDGDPSNDLPLDTPPDTWLSGFPAPESGEFASYEALQLTLEETAAQRRIETLSREDDDVWAGVEESTRSAVHYHWLPGTKVIGAVTFGGRIEGGSGAHGHGSASVSVGNRFGSCPECLLVFIRYNSAASGEAAIEWAMSQPWIDAITNSYGFSLVSRDRFYSGSDTEAQRQASERGQTVFFSAGNGQANTFTAPNTTLFSSQEGPDWIVTVGAVSPRTGGSYSGHGKPADIAGVGANYPSSYRAATVGGEGAGFGGTSNATPTIAGTYARALDLARRDLPGPSRSQVSGVVAVTDPDAVAPFTCGEERPDCELADGVLTAPELRTRLLHGAVHTSAGTTVSLLDVGPAPPLGEDEFLSEGHGTYFARLNGEQAWLEEFERLLAPLQGRAQTVARPDGEREWMTVDSYCRQHLWGAWSGGYYVDGVTDLPGADPLWPVRSLWEAACPSLFPPVSLGHGEVAHDPAPSSPLTRDRGR